VRPWVGDVGDCSEESDFSRACLLAERRPCHQASQMRIAIITAPSAAPTPIAALSPVESPLWDVVVDDAVLLVDAGEVEVLLGGPIDDSGVAGAPPVKSNQPDQF